MKCHIYRSSRKEGTYLFLSSRDEFSVLPDNLMSLFGTPAYVMELDITPQRSLAAADTAQVLQQLKECGYYLQMPPADHIVA